MDSQLDPTLQQTMKEVQERSDRADATHRRVLGLTGAPTPPASPNILEEASEVTAGDRQHFYGHPADNHGNTAELWTAYMKRKFGFEGALDARDVCMLMILLKVSRDANRPKRDNLVDLAGYARNADQIAERNS